MAYRLSGQNASRRFIMPQVMEQWRGMATEKQILNQIQATKNIQKITSSMKMVSAAKLKGDEGRLSKATPFNKWTSAICGEPILLEDVNVEEMIPKKTLIVPISSDRGLCGGVNSFVTRGVRDLVNKMHPLNKEAHLVVIGDKGRAQLRRMHGPLIKRTTTDSATIGTFALASAITTELIAAGCATDYDAVAIVYNSFVNPVIYRQRFKLIKPLVGGGEDEALLEYEFEPDIKTEIINDMYEYILASQIYHSFLDAAASEQSSRMTAMENASKNAGEMISSLTLRYNRARQARITTELIEIISGAAALDKD